VGLIRLTEKQARRLGTETAHEYNSTNSYVGVLEVLHQLHCLVSIFSTQSYPSRDNVSCNSDTNSFQEPATQKVL